MTDEKRTDTDEIRHALREVDAELRRASSRHGSFNSAHEGYAIILEELDELWEEVRKREKDPVALRKEAMQVAAMALRFMVDVCPGEFRG